MTAHRKKFMYVPAKLVRIDRIEQGGYQRPLDPDRALDLAINWDEDAFQPLTVNVRDDEPNRFILVDGQHRFEAIGLRDDVNQLKDLSVPAVVYYGMTREEEAKLYRQLNTVRKNTHAIHAWKARIAEGDDTVIAIEAIVKAHGFMISAGGRPEAIAATTSLEELYVDFSSHTVNKTLCAVKNAYIQKHKVNAPLLRAVGLVVGLYEPIIDHARLAETLAFELPTAWLSLGRQMATVDSSTLTRALAHLLVTRYNRRLSEAKSLPPFDREYDEFLKAKASSAQLAAWRKRHEEMTKKRPVPGQWLKNARTK